MKTVALIKLTRPVQWVKNLMLYFPAFLGGMIFDSGVAAQGTIPFFSFCLASSATYCLNDALDADHDLNHPLKKGRPIPSGQVSKHGAVVLSLCLMFMSLYLGYTVQWRFLLFLATYLVVSISYSYWLKNIPVVDLMCISAVFLLRLGAGGAAFDIKVSDWLFLCVFLLSLFLAAGKRLFEKQFLGEHAGCHRRALTLYPAGFLEGTLHLTGAAALVTYAIYSIPRQGLAYTVPLCTFGLLRYIFRVRSGESGDPTESMIRDLPLLLTSIVWALCVGLSIYR